MTGRHNGADGIPPAGPVAPARYAGHGLMVGTLVLLLLAATPGHAEARERYNPWAGERPAETGGTPERSRSRFPARDYEPTRRDPQTEPRDWTGPLAGGDRRTSGQHVPGAHGPGAYPYPGGYPGGHPGWQGGSGYAPWATPGYGMPWGWSPFGGGAFP